MSNNKKQIESYALNSLREYLIYNDIEINSVEELRKSCKDAEKQGYFWKALECDSNVVVEILKRLEAAYTKDNSIIESDLIYMGARSVIEKIEQIESKKKKRSVK